jgi:sugar lactone lactonase YvrE
MAFMESKLLLSDTKRSGLWVLYLKDRLRRYQKLKSAKPAGKLSGLALDKQGEMYATNIDGNFVQLYNRHNRLIKHLSNIGRPIDVAVYGDKVYVLDIDEHTVEVWSKDLSNLETKIGKEGHNPGEFFMPSSIAVDSEGSLYVVDTGNARVQKFDQQGRFLLSIGQLGDTPGCFMRPKGVAVDRRGNIYVADPMLQYVQLFDPQGNLLLYFGKVPVEELNLRLPAKIILDYNHIDYFKEQTDPGFKLEYLILVSNQLGPNKVNVYGFGHQKTNPADTTH